MWEEDARRLAVCLGSDTPETPSYALGPCRNGHTTGRNRKGAVNEAGEHAMAVKYLIVQASHVKPNDMFNGTRKVVWAIPNYLKKGETEIKFDDGATLSVTNKRGVSVTRND
jgi:hypothetical protein